MAAFHGKKSLIKREFARLARIHASARVRAPDIHAAKNCHDKWNCHRRGSKDNPDLFRPGQQDRAAQKKKRRRQAAGSPQCRCAVYIPVHLPEILQRHGGRSRKQCRFRFYLRLHVIFHPSFSLKKTQGASGFRPVCLKKSKSSSGGPVTEPSGAYTTVHSADTTR